MILKPEHSIQYLIDVKDGKITEGLGLGNEKFDSHIRFKRGQMNMLLGSDNVGKSYLLQWYFLALSSHHNLKWTLWMGEDEVGEIMINLIQFISGKHIYNLSHDEIRVYMYKVEQWFSFVDPAKSYTPQDMLKMFRDTESDGFLIDPYTGLHRKYGFGDNYDFLNETREFCNQANRSVYVTLHPSTESQRSAGIHKKGDNFEGYVMPPKKADAEGGQSFANRADDFWIAHRYTQHPSYSETTMLHVVKNKRNRTGGKPTLKDDPIMLEFNRGLGFTVNGMDLIKRGDGLKKNNPVPEEYRNFYEPLKPNNDFDTVTNYQKPDDCPF